MTRKKTTPTASIVRSSAAEYLTFVAATGDQSQSFEMRLFAVIKYCLTAACSSERVLLRTDNVRACPASEVE